jgi:hypothetical protein
MRVKNQKHAEFEVILYLLTGCGANLQPCEGLSDVFSQCGGELNEDGDFLPESETDDKPVRKRLMQGKSAVASVLHNMLEKRVSYLPTEHSATGMDVDELKKMITRLSQANMDNQEDE